MKIRIPINDDKLDSVVGGRTVTVKPISFCARANGKNHTANGNARDGLFNAQSHGAAIAVGKKCAVKK